MNECRKRANLFQRLRDQVVHEDGLINQRLNWLLLSQGFLFIVYGGLSHKDVVINEKTIVVCVLSSFGYFISLCTFVSILDAFKSLGRIRMTWDVELLQNSPDKSRVTKENISFQLMKKIRDQVDDKELNEILDKGKEELLAKEGIPQVMYEGRPILNAIGAAGVLPLLLMTVWTCIASARLYNQPIPVTYHHLVRLGNIISHERAALLVLCSGLLLMLFSGYHLFRLSRVRSPWGKRASPPKNSERDTNQPETDPESA